MGHRDAQTEATLVKDGADVNDEDADHDRDRDSRPQVAWRRHHYDVFSDFDDGGDRPYRDSEDRPDDDVGDDFNDDLDSLTPHAPEGLSSRKHAFHEARMQGPVATYGQLPQESQEQTKDTTTTKVNKKESKKKKKRRKTRQQKKSKRNLKNRRKTRQQQRKSK